MYLLLIVLLALHLREGEATSCPRTAATRDTKPLYLLTLVPFPDPREGTGWDGGLGAISGARIARDEINNRTDLLPGYHVELIVDNIEACSLTEAGMGLVNLVKYTVRPPCRPVIAVIGLICSSHTSIVSPIAGHEGFDLIQISVANSPIFKLQKDSYPHLWRFKGSATVYVDAALAIMDHFNWQRIAVVYDAGSVFHTEIARYFRQMIKVSENKTLVFDVGVHGTRRFYFDHILSNLRNDDVTILFVSLNRQLTSILLNRTFEEGFIYPQYTWIVVESLLHLVIQEKIIEEDRVNKASHGHIHLFVPTESQNESEISVSGELFSTFKAKYKEDFEIVRKIYNEHAIVPHLNFASYLYDQVWALALAVNNSLPVLENRNISIDNYTTGRPDITAVIEEELAKLNFQGAGGLVEFNQFRDIFSSVKIFWVSDNNGTEKRVGIYNPLNSSNFSVDLNTSEFPKDRLPKVDQLILIPLPVAILLYILAGVVIIFTTVQLFLYLHYRDHKAIKATSPYLSLLMFAGCYLFCFAAILNVTYGSFPFFPTKTFTLLLHINIVLVVNAFSLILVTLFIRLLRVYRIFFSRLKMDLGNCWRNFPLLLIIVVICILFNIITAIAIIFERPEYDCNIHEVRNESAVIREKHFYPQAKHGMVASGFVLGFLLLFLLLICFLAIRTRKIRHSNFKDTKKINIFVVVLIFTLSFITPLYFVLLSQQDEPAANVSLITGMLFIPMSSQLILFLPKVLPVVLDKCFPGTLDNFNSFFSTTQHRRLSVFFDLK